MIPGLRAKKEEEEEEAAAEVPVSRFSCPPKAITGKAEAKKIQVVGANILSLTFNKVQVHIHQKKKVQVHQRYIDLNLKKHVT